MTLVNRAGDAKIEKFSPGKFEGGSHYLLVKTPADSSFVKPNYRLSGDEFAEDLVAQISEFLSDAEALADTYGFYLVDSIRDGGWDY